MTWIGSFFAFTPESIRRWAPASPGVYLLWRRGEWIYIGVTDNIRGQLLALAAGDNECVTKEAPTDFGFELIADGEARSMRHRALINQLAPICP